LQQYLCWAFAFLSVKIYELFPQQTISKLLKILKHFFKVREGKVFINKSQLSSRKRLSKHKTEKSVLAKKHVKRLKAFQAQISQKVKSICPAETVLQM